VQSEEAWDSLAAVASVADGRTYGAGTVLRPEQVLRARDAGCSVVIGPNFSDAVLDAAAAAGLDYWPGVMTATELANASAAGASTLKLYPAGRLGPGYVRDLRGPFPHERMVAVGGISVENAVDYLKAGADGVALGSSIVSALQSDNRDALRELVNAVRAR
jgi:2-dehydro-3-deoxyphosphogluconate aldolase/(4S)-4-hydroxy-2-oxoglutarate aldolase